MHITDTKNTRQQKWDNNKNKYSILRGIEIDPNDLWSFDVLWTNPNNITKLNGKEKINLADLNIACRKLKTQQPPIILKMDIQSGKILGHNNMLMAHAAKTIGIYHIPVIVINYHNDKPIIPTIKTEKRYNHYHKFIPYNFSTPVEVLLPEQKEQWLSKPHLINNRQLFTDNEWQDLRKSLLKYWKENPDDNISKLKKYMYKDILKIYRVKGYFKTNGFASDAFNHPSIQQFISELPA